MTPKLDLAIFSCMLLGLRHGFDYDHLAAITDIASVQRKWKQSMWLGFLYALGHAVTVAALGSAVIFFHLALPVGMDSWAERLVGVTLIVLGLYVLASFFRNGHKHVISQSRIAMLISGVRWAFWKVSCLFSPGKEKPEAFTWNYDRKSVFFVGVIHGLGAETPSQLMLFLLAANLGGTDKGFYGLAAFLVGLLAMNTLMTASATGIFKGSAQRPALQGWLTALTASYSFVVGMIFLFGVSDKLPPLGR
ncbi:MAG: hypothetical protein ACYC46_01155 [Acidobacteriaceae bacterium]